MDDAFRIQRVKAALECLRSRSIAAKGLGGGGTSVDAAPEGGFEIRLVGLVADLARSANSREAEAGRLLMDYYVKCVGTQEVVMARLYLSRPTFYRRLRHGLALVSRRVDLEHHADA